MKRHSIPLALAIAFPIGACAQFTLEHSYAGGGIGPSHYNEFYSVHLETLGDVYALVDKTGLTVQITDLDHQVLLTIPLTNAPDVSTSAPSRDVLYISQHLFDLDDEIELMYLSQDFSSPPTFGCRTSIMNEDGTVIQTWVDEGPFVNTNAPQEQLPIYNTTDGCKLILSSWTTWEAKVYSLPGNLQMGINGRGGQDLISAPVKIYPNPTASEIVVDVSWQRIFKSAVLVLINSSGNTVAQHSLSPSIQHIDISSLAAGEYKYSVVLDGRVVNTGTMTKL